MNFPLIILLIGFSIFSPIKSSIFPDEVRLKVGECLDKIFLRDQNWMRRVEDYLFSLCDKTKHDLLHFSERLEKEQTKPKPAYDEFKTCLTKIDEINAEKWIERYEEYALEPIKHSGFKILDFSEINQVVVGLCAEREWVVYEELEEKIEQPKAFHCLRGCAAKLFDTFEKLIKIMKIEYQLYLKRKQGKNVDDTEYESIDGKKGIDENDDIDKKDIEKKDDIVEKDDNQAENQSGNELQKQDVSKNDEQSKEGDREEEHHHVRDFFKKVQKKLHIHNTHYEYKEGIPNYEETCEKSEDHDIETLTIIGKIWAKHYIDEIEKRYEIFHFEPIKEEVKYAFNSYLHCSRWVCAMGHREDIPFLEYVADVRTEISMTARFFIDYAEYSHLIE